MRAALADSVAEDKGFQMVTEHIGISSDGLSEVTPVASPDFFESIILKPQGGKGQGAAEFRGQVLMRASSSS